MSRLYRKLIVIDNSTNTDHFQIVLFKHCKRHYASKNMIILPVLKRL